MGKWKQQPKQITSDSCKIICVMCLGTRTLPLNPSGSRFPNLYNQSIRLLDQMMFKVPFGVKLSNAGVNFKDKEIHAQSFAQGHSESRHGQNLDSSSGLQLAPILIIITLQWCEACVIFSIHEEGNQATCPRLKCLSHLLMDCFQARALSWSLLHPYPDTS